MTQNPDTTTRPIEAEVIIKSAIASVDPKRLDEEGRFIALPTPYGHTQVIDIDALINEAPDLLDAPRRKTGRYTFTEVASFVQYVQRHETEGTEVYADRASGRVIAVIDGHHMGNLAGHHQHIATLILTPTTPWQDWTEHNGKLLTQTEFAEHIEDNLPDIIDPDPATFLEVIQTFTTSTSVSFESAIRLDSGLLALHYREEGTARAGQKLEHEIPTRFKIAVAPWEGLDPYAVTARLRWRAANGDLRLGYKLDRIDDVLRLAFEGVCHAIDNEIGSPIFQGRPAV